MEKKRGEEKQPKNHHFRSLAFLNRPPAIFTPPEIAQSHEIKPCSAMPAKQKDNLQAGMLTEGPLFAGGSGPLLPDSFTVDLIVRVDILMGISYLENCYVIPCEGRGQTTGLLPVFFRLLQ